MLLAQSELWAATISPTEPSTPANPSITVAYSMYPRPPPPYCSGKITPRNPISPSIGISSDGNWDASSHSITCGAISVSANPRTLRRSCCCSSVKEKSTQAPWTRMTPNAQSHRLYHSVTGAKERRLGVGFEATTCGQSVTTVSHLGGTNGKKPRPVKISEGQALVVSEGEPSARTA